MLEEYLEVLQEVRLAGQLLLARGRATHTEVHAAFSRYDDRARSLLRTYATAAAGAGEPDDGDAAILMLASGDGGAGGGLSGDGAASPQRSDGLSDILPNDEDVWLLSLRWHTASAWQRALWNDGMRRFRANYEVLHQVRVSPKSKSEWKPGWA